ncbi:hypothetical protein ACNQ13_00570 [Mycoplasma sp. VS428]|uniref:hypothetical protein n=1 Tax=unclassified Mycoplasma TaxID=2683645 RepID=UPI003AAFAB8B
MFSNRNSNFTYLCFNQRPVLNKQDLLALLQELKVSHGLTLFNGPAKKKLKHGYLVNIKTLYKAHFDPNIISLQSALLDDIVAAIDKFQGHIGFWYNYSKSCLYVDQVKLIYFKFMAKMIAFKHHQLSIYDLKNKTEIQIKQK